MNIKIVRLKLSVIMLSVIGILSANAQQQNVNEFNSVDVEIFNFSGNVFFSYDKHADSTFSGTDTVYMNTHRKVLIKVIVQYENGEKIKATGYYSDGVLHRETHYNGRTLHGRDTRWYHNGQKEFQAYYENGITVMPRVKWYEEGNLESVYDRDTALNVGGAIGWHPNGIVKYELLSIDSSKSGYIATDYYNNGQVEQVYIADAGNQPFVIYYKNGQKSVDGKIHNALWYQIGKWQEWDETGIMLREYYFGEPNIKEGTWSWWNENGYLVKQEFYKNGVLLNTKEYLPSTVKKSD